ncbi:MAG: hypothetical protein GY854_04930 [Deltaproteobacteria bacterium]|nr:hypothetical protein [Deltaproteobacteria bacterium]
MRFYRLLLAACMGIMVVSVTLSSAHALSPRARRSHERAKRRLEHQAQERAARKPPFEHSKGMGQGTPSALNDDPNRMDIVFDPKTSERATPCESIEIVQVVQRIVEGQPVKPGDGVEKFRFQDETALDDDPGTPENETGATVDHHKGWTTPGANSTGNGFGMSGTKGKFNMRSTFWDTPNTNGGDQGFKSPTNPNGSTNIRLDFESCAFCAKGHDCPDFFECVTWRLDRTPADADRRRPVGGFSYITGVQTEPSGMFKKAFEKFKGVKKYEPCSDD